MSGIREKVAWALAAALGLLVVAAFTGVIEGGSLDPPGPPGSTMKSLDDIPGSWSRVLPADDGAPGPNPPAGCDSSRFECLEDWNNALVLDRVTGLVWSRDMTENLSTSWEEARRSCLETQILGRRGFRLPALHEIMTLVQLFVGTPALPPGSPLIVNTDDHYWTSTSLAPGTAAGYSFSVGVSFFEDTEVVPQSNYFTCVRAPE